MKWKLILNRKQELRLKLSAPNSAVNDCNADAPNRDRYQNSSPGMFVILKRYTKFSKHHFSKGDTSSKA